MVTNGRRWPPIATTGDQLSSQLPNARDNNNYHNYGLLVILFATCIRKRDV